MALKQVVALAGGVGGAKLAHGLAQVLPAEALTVVVNIGDDFRHYGFHIAPDLDTVMYTLSGLANTQTGWGVMDETWQAFAMLEKFGEAPWFRLGDRDLGTHILRRHLLENGATLTEVTRRLYQALGVEHRVLPASDDLVPTLVQTAEAGILPFQEYFVKQRWQPTVTRLIYQGAESAKPSAEVISAFEQADLFVICPSNPLLSIDPILALGDLRARLGARTVPCIAVSPLIHGQAVKGPAHKLMAELGHEASSDGLMRFYAGLIDALVVEGGDAPSIGRSFETQTLIPTGVERARLAREVLAWGEELGR